jgi:hypothetical protein
VVFDVTSTHAIVADRRSRNAHPGVAHLGVDGLDIETVDTRNGDRHRPLGD